MVVHVIGLVKGEIMVKRSVVSRVGIACVSVLVFATAGCGSGGFSAQCKFAINSFIDAGQKMRAVYDDPTPWTNTDDAPCGMDKPADASAALEQACADLQAIAATMSGACGEDYSAALEAVMAGQRQ